ncbi:NADH dehydrogenase [ubiquinone] 1 beta subcomplex subunit 9 -like protein [Gossypium arboreum]|uniref:NADH dehydrogenase [ubiquinone] 1 beta subcomplex subunit 9 n=1 Tax=Gossypium arboreum TaxID=29729 RepID=A0A0B0MQK6_GOSAR|nr:NADH dehydrogenase [ubiquinone] 1 beta subcomplex subunit 9 -like protein [Gossypium arboreum]
MSGASTAAYLARRAAQKERVRILYRRALKDTLNWAVHRHLFYQDASDLREKFEANKHVEDLDTIDKMIDAGEATYNKWRHPDPYIVPWAPGGSKFTRNPVPPSGFQAVHTEADSIPLSRLVYRPVPSPTGWSVLVSTTLDICARIDAGLKDRGVCNE